MTSSINKNMYSTWNPESKAWNPESNRALDSLKRGKGIAPHTKKNKLCKEEMEEKKNKQTDLTNGSLQVHNGSYI